MQIGSRLVYHPPRKQFVGPGLFFSFLGFVGSKPELKVPIALALGGLATLTVRYLQRTVEEDGVITGRDPDRGNIRKVRLAEVQSVRQCRGVVGAGDGWSLTDVHGNSVFVPKNPSPSMSYELGHLVKKLASTSAE